MGKIVPRLSLISVFPALTPTLSHRERELQVTARVLLPLPLGASKGDGTSCYDFACVNGFETVSDLLFPKCLGHRMEGFDGSEPGQYREENRSRNQGL